MGAHNDGTREVLIELCLITPARLNFLLPHMHLLMRPLVMALNADAELATHALKKLEVWIDSLHPTFLDPLLANIADDLVPALYRHVQSGNNALAMNAFCILGKLGGRTRKLMRETFNLVGKGGGLG
jgi:transformation/transcription domain-associated protein